MRPFEKLCREEGAASQAIKLSDHPLTAVLHSTIPHVRHPFLLHSWHRKSAGRRIRRITLVPMDGA